MADNRKAQLIADVKKLERYFLSDGLEKIEYDTNTKQFEIRLDVKSFFKKFNGYYKSPINLEKSLYKLVVTVEQESVIFYTLAYQHEIDKYTEGDDW